MAEEGNNTEGQESSGEAAAESPKSDAQWFAENFIPADFVHPEANFIPFDSPEREASMRWAQAVAKDERAQKPQRHAAPSTRSPASLRAMHRARQDWQRTVQRVAQQPYYPPPPEPRAPYAKGNPEAFWGKFLTGFFRIFGLV
jgi:hypothetical protein